MIVLFHNILFDLHFFFFKLENKKEKKAIIMPSLPFPVLIEQNSEQYSSHGSMLTCSSSNS